MKVRVRPPPPSFHPSLVRQVISPSGWGVDTDTEGEAATSRGRAQQEGSSARGRYSLQDAMGAGGRVGTPASYVHIQSAALHHSPLTHAPVSFAPILCRNAMSSGCSGGCCDDAYAHAWVLVLTPPLPVPPPHSYHRIRPSRRRLWY